MKVSLARVGSASPRESIDQTWNVSVLLVSPVYVIGEVQLFQASV